MGQLGIRYDIYTDSYDIYTDSMYKKIIASSINNSKELRINNFINKAIKDLKTVFAFQDAYLENAVTIYTSARNSRESQAYEFNRKLGALLVKKGFQVLTGGGPGGMEALSRGAKEAGGQAFGIDIELPFENKPNEYLEDYILCEHFFTRKLGLLLSAKAIIATPGGFGTHDELFEIIKLKDKNSLLDIPIVLIGKEYYSPLWDCCKISELLSFRPDSYFST
jgi:uncharacterized protein (TIGR00730 family)